MERIYRLNGDQFDPEPRTIFSGVHVHGEGQNVRQGLNIYPLREWKYSRGFILRLGSFQYRCRWSVKLRRLFHGWERRPYA